MPAKIKGRERVARNFIRTYGRARFKQLINGFATGESGQVLADEFNVSRERIRQWKNTFGEIITIYHLHPEIQKILNKQKRQELDKNPAQAQNPAKK